MIPLATIKWYQPSQNGGSSNVTASPVQSKLNKTPLQVAQNLAGIVETMAYGSGLKQGGLNIRNDGKLSRNELNAALKNIQKTTPKGGTLLVYLLNRFKYLDKPTSGGKLPPSPPDSKLSHQELVDAMQLKKNPKAELMVTNPYFSGILSGKGIIA